MGENWMAIFREMTGGRDLDAMIEKYLEPIERTEEEIHAERSERFLQDNHIVCPFDGYEELHEEEPVEVGGDELLRLFREYEMEYGHEEEDRRPRQNTRTMTY